MSLSNILLPSITAVIFDLDGVLTDTASLHFKAWQQTFDQLEMSFTLEDYQAFVDGRPRYQGADNFMQTKGIKLPMGNTTDDISDDTIYGIGNYKNKMFEAFLQSEEVQVFDEVKLQLKLLQARKLKLGVVTSSRHGEEIVAKTQLQSFFNIVMDGKTTEAQRLKGKPEADAFLAMAQRLHTPPRQTAIVEDASAGIIAGKQGKFGMVIGIARDEAKIAGLLKAGADIVLSNLGGEEVFKNNDQLELKFPFV